MSTNREQIEINKLECVVLEPTDSATHSVIWLHGLGADANDFIPIVNELKLPSSIRFIFPNAPVMPVSINQGYPMPAWFDIYSDRIINKIDTSGILNSTITIQGLMNNEVERGIAANKIILAGFSQGALIAMTAGLNYSATIGGVIALSGYLPADCLTPQNDIRHTPVFLAHGTQDHVVPFTLGETSHQLLKTNGYQVDWHAYPMTHSVCAEEVMDISNWMARIVK